MKYGISVNSECFTLHMDNFPQPSSTSCVSEAIFGILCNVSVSNLAGIVLFLPYKEKINKKKVRSIRYYTFFNIK